MTALEQVTQNYQSIKPKIDSLANLREKTLHVGAWLADYLHVTELPGNRGLVPDAANECAGVDHGSPWCLSVQMLILYLVTGKRVKMAHCQTFLNTYKGRCGVKRPRRGDYGLIVNPNGSGHAVQFSNIGLFKGDTLEGNTNDAGSREGLRFMRRNRSFSQFKGFIDLDKFWETIK